jgi:hypothetical protein
MITELSGHDNADGGIFISHYSRVALLVFVPLFLLYR